MKWFMEMENGEFQEIDLDKFYHDIDVALVESIARRYDEDIITITREMRYDKNGAKHTGIDIGNYGLYSPTGFVEPEGMFLYN